MLMLSNDSVIMWNTWNTNDSENATSLKILSVADLDLKLQLIS